MSALAIILAAGMAVGDGPGKASGKSEAIEQRLDMRGEWEGQLQWGNSDLSGEVRILDGMLRSNRFPDVAISCEICEEGKGRVRVEMATVKYLGIYRREGNEYTICFRRAREGRPTDFRSDPDHYCLTIHRLKTSASDPVELPKDVVVTELRQFAMPLQYSGPVQDKIETTRMFVSEDQGKSWKHLEDYKPDDKRATFAAPPRRPILVRVTARVKGRETQSPQVG